MRLVFACFMAMVVQGQGIEPVAPACAGPTSSSIRIHPQLSPREMIRAMVALEQTQRNIASATVEVIGYDDQAVLKLISLSVAQKARLEFHPMNKLQQVELYHFMHQNVSNPTPFLFVPKLPGP